MFKRVTWLGVGFTLGVGTTVVAARRVRRSVERYTPNAVVDRVAERATRLRDQLAAAIDDGREAAREREAELREAAPGRTTPTPGRSAPSG